MKYAPGDSDTSLEWGGPSMHSGIRMTPDGALETVPYKPLTPLPVADSEMGAEDLAPVAALTPDEVGALGKLAGRELVDATL